jgi:hypothetical protein
MRGAVAAVATMVLLGAPPVVASGAPVWQEGVATNVIGAIPSPSGAIVGPVTLQSAGFLAETDGSGPRVGEVIYIRGRVGVVPPGLNDAPLMTFFFDPALAPDVSLAISPATPVRCSTTVGGGPAQPVNCPQAAKDVGGGRLFFGGLSPQAGGQTFEVQVPIRVAAPKNGLATGAAARFGVEVTSVFGSGAGQAVQYLVVPPAAGAGGPGPAAGPASRLRVVAGPRGTRVVRFRLAAPARVGATVQRRRGRGYATVRRRPARALAAGARRIALGRLGPGRYRVVLAVRDGAGDRSVARRAFVVR